MRATITIKESKHANKFGKLILSDGTVFDGMGFGYSGSTFGEIVFNTGMVVTSEKRDPREDAGVSTAFFSVQGGDEPKILGNYVFENEDGRKAILKTTTQDLQTPDGTVEFKILQLSFINSEYQYSIIYVNVTEWFRYELGAFLQTVDNFEIMLDGNFSSVCCEATASAS